MAQWTKKLPALSLSRSPSTSALSARRGYPHLAIPSEWRHEKLVCSSSQLAPRIGLYTASLVSLTDVLIGWCASDCDAPTHIVTYPNKHGEYPPSPTWRASPTWRKQKAFPLPVEKAGNSLLFSEAADSPMLATWDVKQSNEKWIPTIFFHCFSDGSNSVSSRLLMGLFHGLWKNCLGVWNRQVVEWLSPFPEFLDNIRLALSLGHDQTEADANQCSYPVDTCEPSRWSWMAILHSWHQSFTTKSTDAIYQHHLIWAQSQYKDHLSQVWGVPC